MRYFRTEQREWPVFLALFALYVQALLPLGMAIPTGTNDDGFPSRMIICTSYGFELVDVTTGETVVEGQTDDRSCPVCDDLAIGASSLINFDVPSIETVQLRVVATLTPAKTFQVALQSFARNRNPRAPPISA